MKEHFTVGYQAAKIDKYWERFGYDMHHDRELTLYLSRVADGLAREYHIGYIVGSK